MEDFLRREFMKSQARSNSPEASARFEAYLGTRAPGTRQTYRPSFRKINSFLVRKRIDFDCFGEDEAMDLMMDMERQGDTAASVATVSAVIGWAREARRLPSPFATTAVAKMKRSVQTAMNMSGGKKQLHRREMTPLDLVKFCDYFWDSGASPLDRQVCLLAVCCYLGQKRLDDLRLVTWADVKIGADTVSFTIRKHKTIKVSRNRRVPRRAALTLILAALARQAAACPDRRRRESQAGRHVQKLAPGSERLHRHHGRRRLGEVRQQTPHHDRVH